MEDRDMNARPRLAMFGSSLVSAYWNGAATYYRGVLGELAARGYDIVFYEPDAYERQAHRDIPDPPWARVHVYLPTPEDACRCLEEASDADIVVKASGVGVLDEFLEAEVARLDPGCLRVYWDVDAPATLQRMHADPDDVLRRHLGDYDLVLTYGGGQPVVDGYAELGATECIPIYNALDPATHFPVSPEPRFAGTLGFLGNRLPDREARVREFFLDPARRLQGCEFVLVGSGWGEGIELPANVRAVGHVYTRDHNAFNCSPRAVININRGSMARFGFRRRRACSRRQARAHACCATTGPASRNFSSPDARCWSCARATRSRSWSRRSTRAVQRRSGPRRGCGSTRS